MKVSQEISRLLSEQPKVREAFRGIVGKVQGAGSSLSPYWEMFDAQGAGSVLLGASGSVRRAGMGAQYVDFQYYASGGYFADVTLYQLWPVTVNGKAETLVWRVDLLSTPDAEGGPNHRMGALVVYAKEIERMVNLFQKDTSR